MKVLVSRYDLLVDRLVQLDSKHAGNDDGYFVFEDNIREMLLLWTRDTSFQKCSPSLNGRPVDDSLGNAIGLSHILKSNLYLKMKLKSVFLQRNGV